MPGCSIIITAALCYNEAQNMLLDATITEKSFGDKQLMRSVSVSVDKGEKVAIVGRNGAGKSTLFAVLSGQDDDFTGDITMRRGLQLVATAQEHHGLQDALVIPYILAGVPEYTALKQAIDELPLRMGDNLRLIDEYTQALERFSAKGFYDIEAQVEVSLRQFGLLSGEQQASELRLGELSGGQKRLLEVIKVIHADADLALLDEPTNHMDMEAKNRFLSWMKQSREAMLIVTHDRDVLHQVGRIIELRDNGTTVSYTGNYEQYLRQNMHATNADMNDFEHKQRRIKTLKQKVLDYQRLKEKSRNPGTIQNFKRLELAARAELAELEELQKPSFWIDRDSVGQLDTERAQRYDRYKARNIRLATHAVEGSRRQLLMLDNVVLGRPAASGEVDPLFFPVSAELHEGQCLQLRGRNGAGKSTLLTKVFSLDGAADIELLEGSITLRPEVRVGVYYQEIQEQYLRQPLAQAIERLYIDRGLPISETKVRSLLHDYLFTQADRDQLLAQLSGGQKARFQLIAMLAGDPQLLVLDEPTNHLDLPSIEELELALARFTGAILFVSHDAYFAQYLQPQTVDIEPFA